MTKKPDAPPKKPVFVSLRPDMSREEKREHLLAALRRSGITVHPIPKHEDEGGQDD